MKKRLAIFDLDGTLVDSGKVVATILNQIRIEIGKKEQDVSFFIPWLSLGGEELVANGLEIELNKAKPFLDDFRGRYYEVLTPMDTVYEGVLNLLDHLVYRKVKICICTNKPRNLAEKVLRDTGLEKYFQYMCAGGDLKTKKPNPTNLDVCIKYFREDNQNVILIGDSSIDQKTAAALGVDFAYFMHGYNDGVEQSMVFCSFGSHIELKPLFN
ncbi:MAG: HAD hydrolase-like protein [Deltaproteobacteria bacterium]|nr:HAD hydrolase-like protein [Deltaproteobacteria bacterium]